tara:strand:- start:523 stop:753 length:231 start_codon:yes stop_codon:yes gene_type:complete
MSDITLKLYDVNPDGVRIVVDWGAMVAGSSIFIPCINTNKALQQVKRICVEELEWEIVAKMVIEKPLSGVRVWRLV